MAWSYLDITDPHLVYAILGGFTTLFMLCSSFIKERMYIGEATVATICGIIFGPHAANLIDPNSWGSSDIVTIEFSRIVLVVQCFAIGVELPRFYMERHWRSVVYLLVPVMIWGWLVVSLALWGLIPGFDWLDGLVVAACITATDPVLASSVVGKGKFAKRVPKHLRDLLSAESGCNDGMAFPFVYLSLYLIKYHRDAGEVSFHFVVYVILYECIFGAVYGFLIGYIARHGIKYAEQHDLIDRESFLAFYFVVALFCAGSGSILGLDDLLVGFAAGVGFSNNGWFGEKTEESHVSNVIDLLLNLTYFVYFGTIIPWAQYNSGVQGLKVWRLVIIAIFVIFVRRIPIMLALKPVIPDMRTWREALFAGHFGPIGVGAIFVAILARAELEHGEPVPLAVLPSSDAPEFQLIYLVWPIVTFIVVASIIVHGSSIAVFTLGKRINTLNLTMSYTAAPEDGPSWMNRLPRISSISRSQPKTSETDFEEKEPAYPPGALAPPGGLLRRRPEDDGSRQGSRASSVVSKRRKSRREDSAGGPVSQSAIFPTRECSQIRPPGEPDGSPGTKETGGSSPASDTLRDNEEEALEMVAPGMRQQQPQPQQQPQGVQIYEEGANLVLENRQGEVLDVRPTRDTTARELPAPATASRTETRPWSVAGMRRRVSDMYTTEMDKRKAKGRTPRRHEPARAYQFGNTIIVEDEDGEVVKTYQIPSQKHEGQGAMNTRPKFMGFGGGPTKNAPTSPAATTAAEGGEASGSGAAGAPATKTTSRTNWTRFLGAPDPAALEKNEQEQAADDKKIRFTIGGVGQRMTKEDFIREVQKLDAKTRRQVVDQSSASQGVKFLAKQEPAGHSAAAPRILEQVRSSDDQSALNPSSSVGSRPPRPSEEAGETAAERRRQLAVLSSQSDGAEGSRDENHGLRDDEDETPAERRRREAALGTSGDGADSDDEERAASGMRIRFAEPERGRT
ncbi:Na(+)/H(+) antiporter-like protein [Hapsidospora chrysogenum ATCC 11550]|uniref:Na(+)/H(+) antiporter-like protein n=1 Tax=Hapsidospora chrysogenum (strain ATCC 11550 / CBS 779.69 / DSM 880 / IAM 14645 / JCM 23072 / IMI 49137) TaxID=857340 RepID=A0A086SWF8_HAPC1|nr:Na(+)/H(+) antiporter-like protein [Hapsidospora chrysogenum ATCC 11550]